eukprot:TRINITY_DN28681_c0_g1_i1.p1 TRINITY_DN28681_c0_g1~~TRINITY_DN28681_c0_g1_i1.p1  ORF type:complete len:1450 (+),score=333.65 TRINITY_DN28681_c0_g1_i1:44-4393(+)
MGQSCCSSPVLTQPEGGAGHDDMIKAFGDLSNDAGLAAVVADLAKITEDHPYLKPTGTEPTPHHLLYWTRRCREKLLGGQIVEAQEFLDRLKRSIEYEQAQVKGAFSRFDRDGNGFLDQSEFKFLCAYIGWGEEEAKLMDLDEDQKVMFEEFERFIGHMGGLTELFEHRRQRVAKKNWGVEAPAVMQVGARIRAFYKTEDGKKSSTWREAQVLELNVMPDNGVRLLFGFGEDAEKSERQVVPPSWIFYDGRDSDVVAALREVGILEEQQAFWASIFPQSELRAVERLVPCQRKALANVRANATLNHEKALPEVQEKFTSLGYSEDELHKVLSWIQDLAPMCIHVHIDNVGRFLETDDYYRSQFETGTSCGALDERNDTRRGWENELFGGHYDDAKPFERCKYGALSVMNDYRGITSAFQYGDSYLVLKDARLRTTFAATDSGGIEGSRLAVLDKYAHVLKEYSDNELRHLIEVALANTSMDELPKVQPSLLRGMNSDCSVEWITMGFPDLPQRKGCYYFEIELYRGTESAQAGLLSSQFVLAPRTAGYQGGVGDDSFGWSVDGQHAMKWHDGKKFAWNRYWKTDEANPRQLGQTVTIGLAVNIDARKVWVASDGEWDDEGSPSFGPEVFPKTALSLYPAISLKGRAAFNFGPEFTHKAPEFKGMQFKQWPGMADGKVRVDCPIIGNSDNVGIYKEIQIHGEVNLKTNIQRLVANRKYLDRSKNERSWAIQVDGIGGPDGIYVRTGADGNFPLYTQRSGSHKLACNLSKKFWQICHEESPDIWVAQAPMEEGSFDPPRHSWEVPRESRGIVAVDVFQAAMEEGGVSKEDCKKLMDALTGEDSQRKVRMVYRATDTTSFQEEWAKLQSTSMTAEEAWNLCVAAVSKSVMASFGVGDGAVVETEHPYPPKSASWQKTVCLQSCEQVKVQFSSKCRTYDSCATLRVTAGGLSKASAGVGARVQVRSTTGDSQIHGTLTGKLEGSRWNVSIDDDEVEICGAFKDWRDAGNGRVSTVVAAQEPKVVEVDYAAHGIKVGEEIAGFKLDPASPMTPFSIAGFACSEASGPAQKEGVLLGWYLDVDNLLRQDAFIELEGFDGAVPSSIAEVADDLEGFQKRLEAVLKISEVSLRFFNGLDFQLLPSCIASYESTTVGEEIDSFGSDGEVVTINGFKDKGPAQASGVRAGWQLSLVETFNLEANKQSLDGLSRASVLEDPAPLLSRSKVKLVFEPVEAGAIEYCCGWGQTFENTTVPFNTVQFNWVTDGDGWHSPESRWGIFAVVIPADGKDIEESDMEQMSKKWQTEVSRVVGSNGKISVEPEDWDEARLRALCARNGWEFEWMTEEGERRRRIEGAERARQAVSKVRGKEKDEMESSGAWWRMEAVTKAFAFSSYTSAVPLVQSQQKRTIKPPPKLSSARKTDAASSSDKVVQEGMDPSVSSVDVRDVVLNSKPAHR